MAPLKVSLVRSDSTNLDLIVPFDESFSFAQLLQAALDRAKRYTERPEELEHQTFDVRLNSTDGFLIDHDDVVRDILSAGDVVFILARKKSEEPKKTKNDEKSMTEAETKESPPPPYSVSEHPRSIRVRVVTPRSAHKHENIQQSPVLRDGHRYSLTTTIGELRRDIANHLGLADYNTDPLEDDECNCSLAEHIRERGIWTKVNCSNHLLGRCDFNNIKGSCARCNVELAVHSPSSSNTCENFVYVRQDLECGHIIHRHCGGDDMEPWKCNSSCLSLKPPIHEKQSVLMLHGRGVSETIPIDDCTASGFQQALEHKFGREFMMQKSLQMIGGSLEDNTYKTLPILALCANNRHKEIWSKFELADSKNSNRDNEENILDLHTSEGPILTNNSNLTLFDAGLHDLLINDFLYIFVVHWRSNGRTETGFGKDSLFKAAPHWTLTDPQSLRATAAVLACLRVLTHITAQNEFEDVQLNEVLRLTHLFTRFPPAVRAFHILMIGKTLLPSACAALVQCFALACEDFIPSALIKHDNRRYLEACRLMFGFLLSRANAKANMIKGKTSDEPYEMPYITSLHTLDLKDFVTREKVKDPVKTDYGLMERSTFQTLRNGGSLGYRPCTIVSSLPDDLDSQSRRVILLYGAKSDELHFYETNTLNKAYHASAYERQTAPDTVQISTDLHYLAILCEETQMSVTSPARLGTAKAPCLTLDRNGYLAVYTGKAACAPPDRDKNFYQPLTGIEVSTDVNLIMTSLEPILKAREQDGTALFDAFTSSVSRKDDRPKEMLILCVDCSYSMKKTSGFRDIEQQDIDLYKQILKKDVVFEEPTEGKPLDLTAIKEWLTDHESFEDMLAILDKGGRRHMPSVADDILKFVRELMSRELKSMIKTEKDNSVWSTADWAISYSRQSRRKYDRLYRLFTALHTHHQALSDLLVFRARDPDYKPSTFRWNIDDPIPAAEPEQETKVVEINDFCVTPQEYLCPITSAVFEDPVKTSDGFTYERRAIERWFLVRNSSPMTGLRLNDMMLQKNQPLANQIQKWKEGGDIIESANAGSKIRSLARNFINVKFVAPNGHFVRHLPLSTTVADLHKLAYRGMRGLCNSYSLHTDGKVLPVVSDTINTYGFHNFQEILISSAVNINKADADDAKGRQEYILVRVYSHAKATSEPRYSYWIPSNTPVTVGSILFRHWRFHAHSVLGFKKAQQTVWHELKKAGDGTMYGTSRNSWEPLSKCLKNLPIGNVLTDTALVSTVTKPTLPVANAVLGTGEVVENYEYRQLKVNLYDYEDPEVIELKRQMELRILSRMGVSKQVFGAFINRLIAYDYNTVVGLVTFGNNAKLSQPLTEVIENFRTAVDKMTPDGDTALWDAIAIAIDELTTNEAKYPDTKKRIFCLSDGDDTSSKALPEDIGLRALRSNIVIDSCIFGSEDNLKLKKLSQMTGGYKFQPETLEEAVTICELEPVLSVDERHPTSLNRPHLSGHVVNPWHWAPPPVIDRATRNGVPLRKEHNNLNDSFIRIAEHSKLRQPTNTTTETTHVLPPGQTAASMSRTKRILGEIRDIAALPAHPHYDIYISERNMAFWKIVMSGPPESAYMGGNFVLYLDMDSTYPATAPKGRFVTQIFHPNINRHGKICHSIFDRNWTVDTSNKQILDTVYGLLLVPEFSDPVNTVVTLNYYWDEVAFRNEVQTHISTYAKLSRKELQDEILAPDPWDFWLTSNKEKKEKGEEDGTTSASDPWSFKTSSKKVKKKKMKEKEVTEVQEDEWNWGTSGSKKGKKGAQDKEKETVVGDAKGDDSNKVVVKDGEDSEKKNDENALKDEKEGKDGKDVGGGKQNKKDRWGSWFV